MAEKLNSMPDYQARMPRQPHNISQKLTLTHSTGMELPVYFDMLHLGDELYFNANLSSRFNPLIKPFLGDCDIHLDYFFVPLSVIYTPTTSIFYQTNDLISSNFNFQSLQKSRFPSYDIDANIENIRADIAGPQKKYGYDGNIVEFNNLAFDCLGKSLVRLMDLLQYNTRTLFETLPNANPHTTPWFLCAYHAIHELYFRNDDREFKDYCYNLDQYYDSTEAFSDGNDFLHLNYVNSYRDYFNAVKVSPIGSSVSMLNGESSWNMLSKVESYLYDGVRPQRANSQGEWISNVGGGDEVAVSISQRYNVSSGVYRAMDTANIRQLFMVDKLLRVTGRANKDYESQFLAHFGIKVPHDELHDITHIGHDMISLGTSPVVSQSDTYDGTSGSALGEIGGQGYGRLQGKKRSFKAPFHGVFMIICHAVPKFRYYGGISKLHDLSDPMKFWQPEYDRKGMQPVFSWESDYQTTSIASAVRLGWQFGYEHFKRKYDRVSIGLRNWNQSVSVNEQAPWVLSREAFRLPFDSVNITDHSTDNTTMLANFTAMLSTPHDLDTVMMVRYNSQWIEDLTWERAHELFITDPLITDFSFDVKKVNFMSEYGEPELD